MMIDEFKKLKKSIDDLEDAVSQSSASVDALRKAYQMFDFEYCRFCSKEITANTPHDFNLHSAVDLI